MYDITIIGAGPTGASAAIFAAKAGKKTLVFDNEKSLTNKAMVYNHYGIEEINGPDLLEVGRKQAKNFGAEIVTNAVSNISQIDEGLLIETDGQVFETKYVIFATGTAVDLAEKIGLNIKNGTEPWIEKVIDADAAGRTSIEKIWAAGTIAGTIVQTIVTAGDGAKVAINILSEIDGERYVDHD